MKNKVYTGSECPEGGSEFKVGTKTPTYACNGEKGVIHPGETLAPGATETGAWSFGPIQATALGSEGFLSVPVASFTIPLASPLDGEGCGEEPATRKNLCQVHYINTAGEEVTEAGTQPPTECGSGIGPGVNADNPQAKPGNLCVYAGREEEATSKSTTIS